MRSTTTQSTNQSEFGKKKVEFREGKAIDFFILLIFFWGILRNSFFCLFLTSGGERTPPLHANTKKNIFFSEIATKKKEKKTMGRNNRREIGWKAARFIGKVRSGGFFLKKNV